MQAANSITRIHMFDARNGWARADGEQGFELLRTTNGGSTWQDVSPRPFPFDAWGCQFLRPERAWITVYDRKTFRVGCLRTANAGKSWMCATDDFAFRGEPSDVCFLTKDHGIGESCDFGAGNAYYTFYETRDGGLTWKPVLITPPHRAETGLPPGTIHLCNLGGDKIAYYPPGNVVIAFGDMADEQPKGVVRLSVTTNLGKSWSRLQLPLPNEYADRLVVPAPLAFRDASHALLPVQLSKFNDVDSSVSKVLLFYATSDGGRTWSQRPGTVTLKATDSGYDLAAGSKLICLRRSDQIWLSRDDARSWHVIQPNLNLGESSKREIMQAQFVNAAHGWIIISDHARFSSYGNFSLYRTTDGGKSWNELH